VEDFLRKKKKKNIRTPSIRYGDLPVCTKSYIYSKQSIQTARQAGFLARYTKPNPRPAFRCICFVKLIHAF